VCCGVGTCGVPCPAVGSEFVPEDARGEFCGEDYGAAGVQGGKVPCEETVDVEERHYEVRAVGWGEVVSVDYVVHCAGQIAVCQRNGCDKRGLRGRVYLLDDQLCRWCVVPTIVSAPRLSTYSNIILQRSTHRSWCPRKILPSLN
jgi:hypothetical protein